MVGKRISEYLKEKGIKQAFLVEKTGLTACQISDICIHDRKIDCVEYYKICTALGVDLDYFMKGVE